MKNHQNFTQFKQFQIPSNFNNKICGGTKRESAKADEEIE